MNKKMKKSSSEDRLSSLPDSILHHIFSFLDMKFVVQTTFLSARWRYFWTSMPCLSFDLSEWSTTDKFMNFVDRALFLRDDSSINKFCLRAKVDSSNVGIPCDAYIYSWISVLSRHRVREIYLEINPVEPMVLPSVLFTSAIILLELKHLIYGRMQLPKALCSAPHLRKLSLTAVKLPQGNSNRELVITCPVLEQLAITRCDHGELQALNIFAPLLRKLLVKDNVHQYDSCGIKICTPNLESVAFFGGLYKDYSFESFPNLVSAKFDVYDFYHALVDLNVFNQNVTKVLEGLADATTLELSGFLLGDAIDSLSEDMMNPVLKLFCDLLFLKLKYFGISCYNAVVILLQSCPNIESFFLELNDQEDITEITKDCEEKLSSNCLFLHLRSVEFQSFMGQDLELKFLEFLLKNALVLENLIITSSSMNGNELKDLSMKLQSLPRATSNLTIMLLQN